MKLGPMLLLALAACGTGRDFPDAGPYDASGPAPVAIIRYLFDAGFAPATIAQDFDGNFLCADQTSATLHILDPDGLGEISAVPVVDGGTWGSVVLSAGRGRQAFLSAHLPDGTDPVWTVNLADDSVAPLLASAPSSGFHARRDDDGFVYASVIADDAGLSPGPVVVAGADGGVVRNFAVSHWVGDLASSADGTVYASTVDDAGACLGVLALGRDAGFSLDGGSVPCMLGLQNARTLWLSTSDGSGGTELYRLDTATLSPTAKWTIDGFVTRAHSVVPGSDGSVALLGAGPESTLALGRAEWLAQDGGFQRVSDFQVPSAADAFFDDQGALYIADPAGASVDQIP